MLVCGATLLGLIRILLHGEWFLVLGRWPTCYRRGSQPENTSVLSLEDVLTMTSQNLEIYEVHVLRIGFPCHVNTRSIRAEPKRRL